MDFDKLKEKYSTESVDDGWYGHTNGDWVLLEDLSVGEEIWLDDDQFKVVEMELEYNEDAYSSEVHIVIKTGGEYFKLTGRKDSYGGSSWNDSWDRVSPHTRTEVYYA